MAQTLKFGKGTWATKTGSSMAYNDQNGNYKPLPFNVERDSIATRVNKQGLIEVVGHDKLRIDYTDSAKGVALLENSSTNLVTYSEAFSNSYWAKTRASITSNSTISPDGTLNASKLIEDTANGSHFLLVNPVYTTSSVNNVVSLSLFAKKSERDLQIQSFASGGGENPKVNFNLTNGTATSVGLGATPTFSIQSFGNDWFRCTLTYTVSQSGSGVRFYISMVKDNATSYQGDGTSGVYVWGAMLEENSIASSYIPTSGSTYQRQADVVNGSGNSEVFNDSEGVLFADISALVNDNNFKAISVSESNADNRITLSLYQGSLFAYIADGGVGQFNVSQSVGSVLEFHKTAIKYKANDCAFWIDGFEVAINTSPTTMPSGLKELAFDQGNGGDDFYGKTKELGYYDEILTDEELEYLTSYRSLNELVTELNLNTL